MSLMPRHHITRQLAQAWAWLRGLWRQPATRPRLAGFGKDWLLPLLLLSQLCIAETASETAVKVAFLYNFFKFIEWPENPDSQNRYTLCLSSHNDFGDHLLMLAGKNINGKPLEILINISAKELKACHMLFISPVDYPGDYVQALHGLPVITVSDKAGFIHQGGMIGLIQDGKHLGFEINLDAVNSSNTRISAPLLKLARNILASK